MATALMVTLKSKFNNRNSVLDPYLILRKKELIMNNFEYKKSNRSVCALILIVLFLPVISMATDIPDDLNVAGSTTTNGITNTGNISTGTMGVTGNESIGGTLGVTGAATLNGATTINNTLGVTGNTTVGGTLGVTGATTTNGITNTGNISTGTMGVTGNESIGGTLGVTGATTLNGATTINNTLGVTGNTTVGGTLGVTGATTLNSASVTNNATIGGTLGVTGATTTNGITNTGNISTGTLSTTGAATLNSATVTNNATVGGTLGVTGNTSLSTLTTSGAATLNSASVTNNATIGGTLGVTGATTLNGATTVNNTLSVYSNGSAAGGNTFTVDGNGVSLISQNNSLTVGGNRIYTNKDGVTTTQAYGTIVTGSMYVDGDLTVNGYLTSSNPNTASGIVVNNSGVSVDGLNNTVSIFAGGNASSSEARGALTLQETAASLTLVNPDDHSTYGLTLNPQETTLSNSTGNTSLTLNESGATLRAGNTSSPTDGQGELTLQGNAASLTVVNPVNHQAHGVMVDTEETALSSGNGSTTLTINDSGATLRAGPNTASSDGHGELDLQQDAASLTVVNPTTQKTHGITVNTQETAISGGTHSTSLTINDTGATFRNDDTGGPVKVTGVADGTQANDAVNYSQLQKAYSGVASAAALAGIPDPPPGKNYFLGLGYGSYMGEAALAVGLKGNISDTVRFTTGLGVCRDQTTVSAGVGIGF
jgi:hypothetical protein